MPIKSPVVVVVEQVTINNHNFHSHISATPIDDHWTLFRHRITITTIILTIKIISSREHRQPHHSFKYREHLSPPFNNHHHHHQLEHVPPPPLHTFDHRYHHLPGHHLHFKHHHHHHQHRQRRLAIIRFDPFIQHQHRQRIITTSLSHQFPYHRA